MWDRLRLEGEPPGVKPERVAFLLEDFWRCFGLIPVGIARGELLVTFQGTAILLAYATEIALAAEGRVMTSGVKRLNAYLSPSDRTQLEACLPHGPELTDLTLAHLRLARFVSSKGRECAARNGIPYPDELEASIRSYLVRELPRFGLGHLLTGE